MSKFFRASWQASFVNLWWFSLPLSKYSYELIFSVGFLLDLCKELISISPKRAIEIFLTISSCKSNISSSTLSYLLLQIILSSFASLNSILILTLLPEALIPPVTIKSKSNFLENSLISWFSSLKFTVVCLEIISNSRIIENSVIRSSTIPSTKNPLSSSLLVLAKGKIANLGFLLIFIFAVFLILLLPSPNKEKTSKLFEIFFNSILPKAWMVSSILLWICCLTTSEINISPTGDWLSRRAAILTPFP